LAAKNGTQGREKKEGSGRGRSRRRGNKVQEKNFKHILKNSNILGKRKENEAATRSNIEQKYKKYIQMSLEEPSKNLGIASLVVHIHSGNPHAGPMPGNANGFKRSTTLSGSSSTASSHAVLRVPSRRLTDLEEKILEVLGRNGVVDGMLRRKETAPG